MARSQARVVLNRPFLRGRVTLSAYHWVVSTLGGLVISGAILLRWDNFRNPKLLAWVTALALVGLFPVPTWNGSSYSVTDPLMIAMMLLFPPPVALVLVFVGSTDRREFNRQVGFRQALFNRSQEALASGLGSVAFHSVSDVSTPWPHLVAGALVAATAYSFSNLLFVALATSLERKMPVLAAARALLMDSPREWLLGYLCFGLLGVVIAQLYAKTGSIWAVGLSAIPLMVLGRGSLLHVRSAQQEVRHAQEREARVRSAAENAAAERRDERMQLAAALHDEAIPTFEGINLLALAGAADQRGIANPVLAEIAKASRQGGESLRKIVGDLRKPELGPGGVSGALHRLVAGHRMSSSCEVRVDADNITLPPSQQMLLYQVAREAISNALKHSSASRIAVVLRDLAEGEVVLAIADDGIGFDAQTIPSDHYGMALMRERAEALGSELSVESSSAGTRISLRVPTRARHM